MDFINGDFFLARFVYSVMMFKVIKLFNEIFMKKSYLVIIVIVVLIAMGVGAFMLTRQSDDASSDKSTAAQDVDDNTKNTSDDENSEQVDSRYAVDVELLDGKHLRIADLSSKGITFEVAPSTAQESVDIYFTTATDPAETKIESGLLYATTTDLANRRCERVTAVDGFDSCLQEFMSIMSSTQCSSLKPGDFEQKHVGDFDVEVGKRADHCTFNLETPEDREMHMYGFEKDGYIVVLAINGDVTRMMENPDEVIESVIGGLSVE